MLELDRSGFPASHPYQSQTEHGEPGREPLAAGRAATQSGGGELFSFNLSKRERVGCVNASLDVAIVGATTVIAAAIAAIVGASGTR